MDHWVLRQVLVLREDFILNGGIKQKSSLVFAWRKFTTIITTNPYDSAASFAHKQNKEKTRASSSTSSSLLWADPFPLLCFLLFTPTLILGNHEMPYSLVNCSLDIFILAIKYAWPKILHCNVLKDAFQCVFQ